jgi:NADH-quinone oxidoreductase subunit K
MPSPNLVLILSAVLLAIGAAGVLARRNTLVMLMSAELMLNAANLNLIAFARQSGTVAGQAFALLVMGFAAAEVAVGLALVVALYRRRDSVNADDMDLLKG